MCACPDVVVGGACIPNPEKAWLLRSLLCIGDPKGFRFPLISAVQPSAELKKVGKGSGSRERWRRHRPRTDWRR